MAEAKLDALVLQGNNDHMGGYVRWVTDMPAVNGYPLTVVLPREEAMTVITHGPLGEEQALPPEAEPWYGAGLVLTTASFSSAPYTRAYDAELALRALRPYALGRIGLVGTAAMSLAFGDALRSELPGAQLSEASDLVDRIKAIKSPEEQDAIRRTAALQDAAMEAAFAAIEPGMRDSDVAAIAQHASLDRGAEQGVYLCASSTPGEPALIVPRHLQDRVIREGDLFMLLIETNGPGGQYAELGRTCSLGPVPAQLQEEHAHALAAQRHTVEQLEPGAAPAEVARAHETS